jgi:hypothetical protein
MRYFESILDLGGDVVAGKSTVVIRNLSNEEEWYCLLGILNSKLAAFFLKEGYGALAMDGGINFSPTNVGEIPVPRRYVTRALLRHTQEVILLRQRCGPNLNEADQHALDKLFGSLNEEVFRIYGLNETEKSIVENGVE